MVPGNLFPTQPHFMRVYNTLSRRLISVTDFKNNRYGNWGVCFIYGAFFAQSAAANNTYENSATVRRGVEFLLRTQRNMWRELPFMPKEGKIKHNT